MLLDGSVLEGGGQILRISAALSALLHVPIHVENIRAGRSKPGLKRQHMTGMKLVGDLTGAKVEGCELNSTWLKLAPKPKGERKVGFGGVVRADVGTAGGTMLLAQVSIPCALFAVGSGKEISMRLTGGTNADFAPQIEYFDRVTTPNLKRLGVSVRCVLVKRGYFPKGGGIVQLFVNPLDRKLTAIDLTDPGRLQKITICSYAAGLLPAKVAVDMADSARSILEKRFPDVSIDVDVRKVEAAGNGSNIVLVAETSTGCFLGGDAIGCKTTTPFESGKVAAEMLLSSLERRICVDDFMQDQLIIYMALASGKSRLLTGSLTLHAKTAIHVVKEMTGVEFSIVKSADNNNVIIECDGIGLEPI